MRKYLAELTKTKSLIWAGKAVAISAILLSLPALAIWLGLPPEGDAIDYRVPIIRWMARHRAYPNWPWSYVDDFPMLGELLMLPLYLLHPSLMRLVSIAAYAGIGWVAARLALTFTRFNDPEEEKALFWFVLASVLCFRPMAIQSNLLMTDNLASFFLLAALLFALQGDSLRSGILTGLGMATRYTIWGSSVAIFLALFRIHLREKILSKSLAILVISGALVTLPFILRNILLNGDPVYPLLAAKFQNFSLAPFEGGYGRGNGLIAFMLLPYDFLYTNTFVRPIFDYSLGRIFYIQLIAGIALAIFFRDRALAAARRAISRKEVQAALLFLLVHIIVWFLGSQQARFLVPGLILILIAILISLFRLSPKPLLLTLTLVNIFSVLSVQKDSMLMAIGKKDSIFRPNIQQLEDCLRRSGYPAVVGHTGRFNALGFFNHDFTFTKSHAYGLPNSNEYLPDFVYDQKEEESMIPWPAENPCGWKEPSPQKG